MIVGGYDVVMFGLISGVPMDRGVDDDAHSGSHCCLVAIGRLQVTSTPNTSDLVGSSSASGSVCVKCCPGLYLVRIGTFKKKMYCFYVIIV